MIDQYYMRDIMREIEEAGLISDGHFAYRSGIHSLRLLDRDRLLSDTHVASRMGYALAKSFFLTRSDIVAAPSIWGAGLAQWVGYFLEPRRPVIYARDEEDGFVLTPGKEYIDGKRVLIIDNLILTGATIQDFVQTVTSAGGTPIGIGSLADLSGVDFPIQSIGLLNDELDMFDPAEHPNKANDIAITEVGY